MEADNSSDWSREFEALDRMTRARLKFSDGVCAASLSDDEELLDQLRSDRMFEFAHFFFTIRAMGLDGPDDAGILADLHNEHIDQLLRDKTTLRLRGYRDKRKQEALLKAIFTGDTKPRLEHIWRERPGALDQSNLARFLASQMSSETVRKLVEACAAAGFVERIAHPMGAVVVVSKGVIELILASALREMRIEMSKL